MPKGITISRASPSALSNGAGSLSYTLTVRPSAIDGAVRYEMSNDLETFRPLVEGVDYRIVERVALGAEQDELTLEILVDPGVESRLFFRHVFGSD